MQKSWIEDFEKKYNKPTIEQITVGFSGIDPNPKSTGSSSEEISQQILDKLQELEIRIDSGNIDPDTPEPTPTPSPAPIIQTEDDHEKLNNLLGGNINGHYHLTASELDKLQNLPEHVADGKAATIQIGTVTTGAEGTKVSVINRGTSNAAVLDFVIPRGERGNDGATGAKGSKGDPFTYEDFTEEQLEALKGEKGDTGATGAKGAKGDKGDPFTYEDFTSAQLAALKGEKGDKGDTGAKGAKGDAFKYEDFTAEQLAGLKGDKGDKGDTGATGAKGDKGDKGDPFRYEDFTPEQLEALKVPTEGGGTSNHEALTNLQGGTDNEHYHIEEAQHHKLDILIKALFPTGTDDIYIPYIDDRDPDNPKVLPYTPFVDLPKGTPPEWKIAALPTGYTANSNTFMYYGDFPHSTYNSSLFVKLYNSNSGSKDSLVSTTDFTSWNIAIDSLSYDGIIKIEDGYLNSNTKNVVLYKRTTSSNKYIACGYNTSPFLESYYLPVATSILCAAVSPELGILLMTGKFTSNSSLIGYAIKILKGKTYNASASYTYKAGFYNYINENSLAWSPYTQVFCIAGSSGTATSADGDTWITHTDAPTNLTDLTYREDLECFFARSLDDKLFYASGDGVTWKNVTTTPIPLDTISCVDFCQDTGIYCAVGGTGKYAYFTRDLETWVPTTITNGADITAGSVIYMPSTKKYVLMPTSGSYYYTFDPSEWLD